MQQLGQSLSRLADYLDAEKKLDKSMLSVTEQNIVDYLKHAFQTWGGIRPVSIKPTDGLHDYYMRFLSYQMPAGLYVLDGQRIWTPIDSGQLEVCFLVSVPRESTPVYGITLFKFSKVLFSARYIVIFVGCVGTGSGERFLSSIKGFHILGRNSLTGNISASSDQLAGRVHPLDDINGEHFVIACPAVKPAREMLYTFLPSEGDADIGEVVEERSAEEPSSDESSYIDEEEADDYQDN